MSIRIVHPETGASITATSDQLTHLRISGWMTADEYAEQQAAQAAAPGKDKAPASPAAKPAKTDEGKA